MAEVRRVPLGGPPAGSWLPSLTAVAVVVLVVVISKPWNAVPPGEPATSPTPTIVSPPASTARTGPRSYDPRLFGSREPDPGWELWPAGYVVQFGMAGPVRVADGAEASAGPSGAATAVPGDGSPPAATGEPGTPSDPPLPNGVVDLGPTDHLVALGINTPIDVRLESVRLSVVEPGGITVAIAIVRLPTLWESTHFTVIAPEAAGQSGQPGPWAPGAYQLDLFMASGEVREILLYVSPPLG